MKNTEELSKQEVNQARAEWKEWLKAEKLKITHLDQIPDWFLTNQKKIMEAVNTIPELGHWTHAKFVEQDKFTVLSFKTCNFSELVSNSHSCPENGVENFMRDPSKPLGYIGWSGYLSGSLKRPPGYNSSYPYSEALKAVGLHTGSGGGGNENFSYDFRIYLVDWPGLQTEAEGILNQKRLDAIRARRKEAVAKVRYERAEIVRRLQRPSRSVR